MAQSKRKYSSPCSLLETNSILSLEDISVDFSELSLFPDNSDDLLSSSVILPSKNYDRSTKELAITYEKSKEILLSHKGSGYSVQGYIKTPLNPLMGLISNSQKDIEYVGCLSLSYQEQSGGDMQTIVRGKEQLHSGKKNIGKDKMIELRINLQKKYMRAAAYPEYDRVVKINNPENIINNEQYYLAFHIKFAPDEIRIMDYFIVSQFDKNME